MLISPLTLAAFAVCAVGVSIVSSNPKRSVNRMVFTSSLHVAMWLALMHLASASRDGVVWLKWTTAIAALIPVHFWLVKEAISSDFQDWGRPELRRLLIWSGVGCCLAVIPFTEFFIPPYSTSAQKVFGPGYYFYIAGILSMYVALGIDGLRRMRALTGGRRLALRDWLGGGVRYSRYDYHPHGA